MKNMRLLALVCLIGLGLSSHGQQKELYTQYMFNGLTINPAYAGSHEALSLAAMSRWQWAGFEGAPTTQTISAHSPIKGKNIALGLMISNDEITIANTTSVTGIYTYRMEMGDGYLAMGLQGTLTNYSGDYSDLFVQTGTDNSFNNVSEFTPNFGAGLFYYTSKFYVGFSIPELLNSKVEGDAGALYTQQRHYFLNAGTVFNLSENVKLKPNVLLKLVDGAPLGADFNLNALFSEIIWFGVSYRPPESISGIVQVHVSPRFSVGYAYDYIIQQELQELSTDSHEIMLNYRIPLFRDKVITPRYF